MPPPFASRLRCKCRACAPGQSEPDLFTPSGGAAAILGVSEVIGGISSELTRYETLMISSVKIPHCSHASINTILSDDSMYPWFFRTIPTMIVVLDAALNTILSQDWKRIISFTTEPEYTKYDGLIMIDNDYDLRGDPSYEQFIYPGAKDQVVNHNEAFAYSCTMMIANVYGDKKPYNEPSGKILLDALGDRQHGTYQVPSFQNGTGVPLALIFGSNYTTLMPTSFKSAHRHLPSLTFKDYRIYRSFNSITVTNRIFHTGRLLKFLAVAVILTVIPSLIEVPVYPPIPNTINANGDQWVRCRDPFLIAAVVPILLLMFGVFLVFKTRNVMFLWNEAREISLVIYNIFFGLFIVIFQFFNADLYIATFYMTVAGTYFITTLALLSLFLPKF
ncbi:hypothetical protein BGW39_008390 [Mortierella sp. 14UC]|nr:hypothetical protein BGW39_008390 [Mortierella sp. 14UC]